LFTDKGKLFEYRQIQVAYNHAFEAAGMSFRSTHIMRHGGCRALLNETGDRYIAQQHLGNSSLSSTDVYARRDAKALTEAVRKRWKIHDGGRKNVV
jgi:integrase